MKKETLRIALMFVMLVAASALTAQAQTSRSIVAQIPFDFTVGNQTLPAGQYILRSASRTCEACLLVTSADGKESAVVMTDTAAQGKRQRASVKLNFRRYGDQFFLAQVWTGDAGRQLAVSRRERRLQRELRPTVDVNGQQRASQAETVSVKASLK